MSGYVAVEGYGVRRCIVAGGSDDLGGIAAVMSFCWMYGDREAAAPIAIIYPQSSRLECHSWLTKHFVHIARHACSANLSMLQQLVLLHACLSRQSTALRSMAAASPSHERMA